MKIKLNKDLLRYKKNDTLTIEDIKGIPVDEFWRKRLKDSAIDNCIEVIKKQSKKKLTSKKQKTKEKEGNYDNSI